MAKATVVREGDSPGDPTDYKRVMWRVRSWWEHGLARIMPHARQRMRQRGIEVRDVWQVARYGKIVEHSRPRERWRYRIDGRAVDGSFLAVVVELNGQLLVVTVIATLPGR